MTGDRRVGEPIAGHGKINEGVDAFVAKAPAGGGQDGRLTYNAPSHRTVGHDVAQRC
jgi:hypothetical protein